MKVYLDNNATTLLDPQVKEAMMPFLTDHYANPSSPYESGLKVRRMIEEARINVAKLLGARSEREIIFTSGGTESNNTAINSALKTYPHKRKIVISAIEHSSIKNLCERLSSDGYQVISISVSKTGSFHWDQFLSALDDDVAIVSVMWANNETGVLFPILEISRELKKRNILFHVDAVQAVGKIKIDLGQTEIQFLSFSAHKFHGPKGIGALYIREGSPFHAFMLGGRQERDRRAGTENVAGIIGLETAFKLTQSNELSATTKLRNKLEEELVNRISGSFINGQAELRIPNTTNITIPGVEAETLLIRLSELGIEASSGSACLTGAIEPSHVLMAMGHSSELASSSVRFSLSRFTTLEQIDYVLETMPKLVYELRELNQEPSLRGGGFAKPKQSKTEIASSSLRDSSQ